MLEEQVCAAAPFDAKAMLPNLMQVAAFIAGFALAAFILLLDRSSGSSEDDAERGHTVGALLLALAAVVGLVTAYMFSAVSGDHCLNSPLQFLVPTALMAVAALLMVSGVSVAAATNPKLATTATSLRIMVVVGALLICGRFVQDYISADATATRYGVFVATVEELRSDDDLPAGSTSWLDEQLAIYAESRWPGREDEWPGLLADEFYDSDPSAGMTVALVVVGGAALIAALTVRRSMRAARRSSPDGQIPSEAELVADDLWRRWISRLTVLGLAAAVVTFSSTAGTGELIRPARWQLVMVFALVAALLGLVAQPPLLGDQRSFIDTTSDRIRRLVDRSGDPPPSGDR